MQHGYRVAILPNPKGFRTPDLILYNEKFIAAYDVKTILGQSSVGNRLGESIGQTDRVILNMNTTYNVRKLAKEIKWYFESNKKAQEVMIFKGGSYLSVMRKDITKKFERSFMQEYSKNK